MAETKLRQVIYYFRQNGKTYILLHSDRTEQNKIYVRLSDNIALAI